MNEILKSALTPSPLAGILRACEQPSAVARIVCAADPSPEQRGARPNPKGDT